MNELRALTIKVPLRCSARAFSISKCSITKELISWMNRISLFSTPKPSSDEIHQCLAMLTTGLAFGSGDGHTSIEASLDTSHNIWLIAESRVLAKVVDYMYPRCIFVVGVATTISRLALRRRAASWQNAVKALSVEEVGLCSAMCSGELGSVHLMSAGTWDLASVKPVKLMLAFPFVTSSVLRAHSLDVDCGRHGCSKRKNPMHPPSYPGQGSCQPLAIAASQSSHASSGKVRWLSRQYNNGLKIITLLERKIMRIGARIPSVDRGIGGKSCTWRKHGNNVSGWTYLQRNGYNRRKHHPVYIYSQRPIIKHTEQVLVIRPDLAHRFPDVTNMTNFKAGEDFFRQILDVFFVGICTLLRRLNSPVMATVGGTGLPLNKLTSAMVCAKPAEGPSLGIAPLGQCTATSTDSLSTSPSLPVSCTRPEPGISATSMNKILPWLPELYATSPVTTPGRDVILHSYCGAVRGSGACIRGFGIRYSLAPTDGANLTLKIAYASFPSIRSDDLVKDVFSNRDLIMIEAIGGDLLRYQRCWNGIKRVGCGDEQDFAEVDRNVDIVVSEGVVLLRVQNFEHGC
ncbi:putative ATP-dependent protease La, partial [Aureobasidium melanogenum]